VVLFLSKLRVPELRSLKLIEIPSPNLPLESESLVTGDPLIA
jgi:hypothetical protein